MTWLELYAVFGGPLLAVLIAFALAWWTGRADRRADPTPPPPSSTPR
jgi:hypothetical protein